MLRFCLANAHFCLANAHARLLILATVLLIAATLPLEGQYASYLPVLQTTDADGLGIALVNPTIAEATVTLTVRSYSGALIQKDGVVNPVTLSLPASSQKALQAVEIFGNGISGQTGWIELSASTPAVKGCFMIYDSGLSYIDGSEISSRLSRRLIFPKVSSLSSARVTIVNTAQDLVQGFISAYEDGGGLVGTAVLTLPALGGFSGTVNELVPSIAGFEGYLVVESQTRPGSEGPQSLLGFETYRNRADIALIRAFPEAARQRTAQLAHLVSGGGYSTTLTLLNDRGYSQTIRITAQLEGNGQLYGPRLVGVERIIPPNGRLREPVEQMFGLQGNSLTTGYIRYETQGDTPGVFGYLDYGTTDGIALSAVEAQGQGYSDIFFSVLAENFAYYTGVALLNLNTQPATVTLEMFDRTGGRTGSTIFTLSAGERRTRLLGEFFQSAVDQVGGYIRITSTRPIFALELVGSRATSSFLADVSAQGVNLIPKASGSMVSASAGAEVIAEDGTASILIPPNALSADTPIRVVHSGVAGVQRPSVNQRPVSVVDTAPAGTRLQIPVRLTFSLDAQVPPGMRIPLLAFNRQTSQYETTKFFAAADESGRIASAEVTYLTTFVVSLLDDRPLTVTSLEPSSGQAFTVVIIRGDGFSASATENVVTFAGPNATTVPAQVMAATSTSVYVVVPPGAVTGPVIVQVGSKSSIGLIFTLLTAPAIAPPPAPPPSPPPAPPPSNPPPTSGLSIRVVGNKLVNGSGQTIRLLGVNRSGAEYACVQGWGMFDGPVDAAAVQAIKNWNVNAVRLPMNEDCWLGINGVSPTYAGANYQNAIANFVTLLHQAGIYVLLELQWNAPGTTLATNIGYMADRDHALDFWTSVANFFKNDPAVLFDLFNEPHDISDACWRDGCTTPGGWQAVGMQTMINTIRATGATQPIVVSANGWGNGGIPTYMSYKPSDPLNSLVASVHIYDFTNCTNQSCWDTYLKPMAAAMPLISGEMGETDCAQSFVNTFMNWLDSVGAGYLAWAWVASDCRAFPSLITDYSGTPTAYGVGVRAHLLTQTVENRNLETPTLLAQEPFAGADLGAPLNPIMSSLQVNTALSALADPSLELGFAEMPRSNLLAQAQEPFAGADLVHR